MIGKILGGLAKVILSPIINWSMSLLYGIFIRGPLWLLNTLDHVFQFASGSQVDKMLFDTSIVDGKPQLNFFTSSSPLKYFFLLMLGVAGTLLVIFMGFVIASSITKKKSSGPIRKLGQVTLSASIVFAIPAIFLMILSLTGSLLGAINGQHKAIGSQGINSYKTVTQKRVNRLINSPKNAPNIYDNSAKTLQGLTDEDGGPSNYSLNEIYDHFNDEVFWVGKDSILTTPAEESREALKTFKDIYIKAGSNNELNEELHTKLNNVASIINNLTPKIKDEVMADKVKYLQDNLQLLNDAANNFIVKSNELLSYLDINKTPKDSKYYALMNFKLYFNHIMGAPLAKNPNISSIKSLRELMFESNSLINGDINNPNTGLLGLRTILSDFNQNPLVTTFYRVATGNNDDNWDRSSIKMKNGGFMIMIGFLLILGACAIMTLAILFAITRIFDLALLFIVSPLAIMSSSFDDGQRMKKWVNVVIVQLISIFGMIISLRLFGILNSQFVKALENSDIARGSTGYLISQVGIGFFGLGGMLAAYKSTQTLSSIIGASHGIMAGIQGMQALKALSGVSRLGKAIGRNTVGKAIGFKSKATSGIPTNGKSRSRLGSIGNAWQSRSAKLTSATRGKLGTLNQKQAYQDAKLNKATKKLKNYMPKSLRKQNIKDSNVKRKNIASEYKASKKTNLGKIKDK